MTTDPVTEQPRDRVEALQKSFSAEASRSHWTFAARDIGVPFVVVTAAWLLLSFLPWYLAGHSKIVSFIGTPAEAGAVGDSFGLANSFFSSGALIAVVVTLLLQQKQLSLQSLAQQIQQEEANILRQQQQMQIEALVQQMEQSRKFADVLYHPELVQIGHTVRTPRLTHLQLENRGHAADVSGIRAWSDTGVHCEILRGETGSWARGTTRNIQIGHASNPGDLHLEIDLILMTGTAKRALCKQVKSERMLRVSYEDLDSPRNTTGPASHL